MTKQARKRLVCGVGLNDATYKVYTYDKMNGKRKIIWTCPYYQTWAHVLERCYSNKFLTKNPNYKGSNVCKEWLTFSRFRAWMKTQQWIQFKANGGIERLQLDKDFLSGNKRGKLYSADTCVFVTRSLNNFLTDSKGNRGKHPLGVHFNKQHKKYNSKVQNPFTGQHENLGYFHTVEEAQAFYVARKQEFAAMYAEEQSDPRIAHALLTINWFD